MNKETKILEANTEGQAVLFEEDMTYIEIFFRFIHN